MIKIVDQYRDKQLSEKLTDSEKTLLEKCRADIAKGFMQVGKALGTIRDKKLYRETHKTFEAFVLAEFQMARRTAYRYIEAVVVVENVSESDTKSIPNNVEMTRELTKLEPKKQKEAWKKASETTPKGKKVTASHLRKTINKMMGKSQEEDKKPTNGSHPKIVPTGESKPLDLRHFEEEIWSIIKTYRAIGPKPLAVSLEAIASALKSEKLNK